MKAILKEFREFAVKGNVIDLAVGVIIGAAFNNIVNSLVTDIVNPIISLIIGKVDFSNRFLVLSRGPHANFMTIADAKAAGVATLNYGLFINNVINFLIVAFVIFIIVREINAFRRRLEHPQSEAAKEMAKESNTKVCPFCKSSIPKEATRCAFCTSELSAGAAPVMAS